MNRQVWRTLRRYLCFIAVINLTWEILHLPLYTLWNSSSIEFMVYAVLHCTVGDVLIAFSVLVVALLLCRTRTWPENDYRCLAIIATVFGAGYTIFSEWHNTAVLSSWAYSEWMPVLPVIGTGLSPLAQWIVLPPLAFWWAVKNNSLTIKER